MTSLEENQINDWKEKVIDTQHNVILNNGSTPTDIKENKKIDKIKSEKDIQRRNYLTRLYQDIKIRGKTISGLWDGRFNLTSPRTTKDNQSSLIVKSADELHHFKEHIDTVKENMGYVLDRYSRKTSNYVFADKVVKLVCYTMSCYARVYAIKYGEDNIISKSLLQMSAHTGSARFVFRMFGITDALECLKNDSWAGKHWGQNQTLLFLSRCQAVSMIFYHGLEHIQWINQKAPELFHHREGIYLPRRFIGNIDNLTGSFWTTFLVIDLIGSILKLRLVHKKESKLKKIRQLEKELVNEGILIIKQSNSSNNQLPIGNGKASLNGDNKHYLTQATDESIGMSTVGINVLTRTKKDDLSSKFYPSQEMIYEEDEYDDENVYHRYWSGEVKYRYRPIPKNMYCGCYGLGGKGCLDVNCDHHHHGMKKSGSNNSVSSLSEKNETLNGEKNSTSIPKNALNGNSINFHKDIVKKSEGKLKPYQVLIKEEFRNNEKVRLLISLQMSPSEDPSTDELINTLEEGEKIRFNLYLSVIRSCFYIPNAIAWSLPFPTLSKSTIALNGLIEAVVGQYQAWIAP